MRTLFTSCQHCASALPNGRRCNWEIAASLILTRELAPKRLTPGQSLGFWGSQDNARPNNRLSLFEGGPNRFFARARPNFEEGRCSWVTI